MAKRKKEGLFARGLRLISPDDGSFERTQKDDSCGPGILVALDQMTTRPGSVKLKKISKGVGLASMRHRSRESCRG